MRQQQRKSQSVISPVRIETFYKENKDRFYQEDGVHLRLIQFSRADQSDDELKAKANLVYARLKAGEKFEDLAKEYSQDSRRAKGGDWGWQKRSDLKPEFSEPLFALGKGEVSAPIVLPEGCFILFADDRKFNEKLEQLQDEVIQSLIDRVLIVKEFRKDEKKHIPVSFVDGRISDIQSEQFDNDRSNSG